MYDDYDPKWSEWYAHHRSGTGVRVKIKHSPTAVHGQAGSVSMMVYVADTDYMVSKQHGVSAIRFKQYIIKKNPETFKRAFTAEEYSKALKESRKDKKQGSLNDWGEPIQCSTCGGSDQHEIGCSQTEEQDPLPIEVEIKRIRWTLTRMVVWHTCPFIKYPEFVEVEITLGTGSCKHCKKQIVRFEE